jgi:hypothetical protein
MTVHELFPCTDDPRVEKFRGRWPAEDESLPDPEFYDPDGLLPMLQDGAVVILYGDSGAHKTNLAITLALNAIFDRGARVCYAAGEGSHGVRKSRVPAHCRARGITTAHLTGRFRVSPAVPLLAETGEVDAFIEAQTDFMPDIVIIDTMATATAGQDENAAITAAMLTANGPVGKIRRSLNALVVILAHSGKDSNKGVRGHSGFKGNADAVLHVTADKEAGAIKVYVEKMRDGPDGFSVYFLVELAASGVPVPRKISAAEYQALLAKAKSFTVQRVDPNQKAHDRLRNLLIERGITGVEQGLTDDDVIELEMDLLYAGSDKSRGRTGWTPVDQAAWETDKQKLRKALTNRRRSAQSDKLWADLYHHIVPIGGKDLQWRWYVVSAAE